MEGSGVITVDPLPITKRLAGRFGRQRLNGSIVKKVKPCGRTGMHSKYRRPPKDRLLTKAGISGNDWICRSTTVKEVSVGDNGGMLVTDGSA